MSTDTPKTTEDAALVTRPTPGLWRVTWGQHSFVMIVFKKGDELWCRGINPAVEHGTTPMLVRDDGGVWEKAFLCRVVRRTDVTLKIDTFEHYAFGATREIAIAALQAHLDPDKLKITRIDVLRE